MTIKVVLLHGEFEYRHFSSCYDVLQMLKLGGVLHANVFGFGAPLQPSSLLPRFSTLDPDVFGGVKGPVVVGVTPAVNIYDPLLKWVDGSVHDFYRFLLGQSTHDNRLLDLQDGDKLLIYICSHGNKKVVCLKKDLRMKLKDFGKTFIPKILERKGVPIQAEIMLVVGTCQGATLFTHIPKEERKVCGLGFEDKVYALRVHPKYFQSLSTTLVSLWVQYVHNEGTNKPISAFFQYINNRSGVLSRALKTPQISVQHGSPAMLSQNLEVFQGRINAQEKPVDIDTIADEAVADGIPDNDNTYRHIWKVNSENPNVADLDKEIFRMLLRDDAQQRKAICQYWCEILSKLFAKVVNPWDLPVLLASDPVLSDPQEIEFDKLVDILDSRLLYASFAPLLQYINILAYIASVGKTAQAFADVQGVVLQAVEKQTQQDFEASLQNVTNYRHVWKTILQNKPDLYTEIETKMLLREDVRSRERCLRYLRKMIKAMKDNKIPRAQGEEFDVDAHLDSKFMFINGRWWDELPEWRSLLNEIEGLNPSVNDFLAIQADYKAMYIAEEAALEWEWDNPVLVHPLSEGTLNVLKQFLSNPWAISRTEQVELQEAWRNVGSMLSVLEGHSYR